MKTAIRLFFVSVLACGGASIGCGDDDGTGGSGGTGGAGGGTGGTGGESTVQMVPQLGTQVERMGRPAINTAANHTFDPNEDTKGAAKDAYNQARQDQWPSFVAEVADNLGILDSLDATCGNQLLAGPMPTADRYDALAGVLADDRLWLNLDGTTCDQYLAVEAGLADDCGGRGLRYDVVEVSYSVLAAGALAGVDDTITADPTKTSAVMFPYLAEPQ